MTNQEIKSGPIGKIFMVNRETGKIRRPFKMPDGTKQWTETDEIAPQELIDLVRSFHQLRIDQHSATHY